MASPVMLKEKVINKETLYSFHFLNRFILGRFEVRQNMPINY
jgi:hypothetical protein